MLKDFAKKLKYRITLDDFGMPEYWIDVIPIVALPYKTVRQMSPETIKDDDFMNIMAQCIIDWNIVDENGNRLPLPSEDINSIYELPAAMINYIADKIGNVDIFRKGQAKGS